ncbi:MAG: dehydrogenase [Solirubrobacterales bacterium]|nr:dehydrogenase [Solirubrobacterales bacterium]
MPIKTLQDRRCLITGAASGIGRATAIAAGRRGARLFLTDINDAGLQAVAAEIRGAGGTVSFVRAADISDHGAVAAMAKEIHGDHGSLDVLMNIAGVSTWGTVENLQHEHWQRMVDINLMGPIHVIECFVPPMIAAGRGGHLVNVSSAAGLFGLPWHAAYSASKFGLRGVSEVLRFDLRRHGIGVSLVCPGGVDTPLVGTVQIVGVDRDNPRIKQLVGHFQRRAVAPERVAAAILTGIQKNRYMVYSSSDVRVGYWFQRKFALPYELAMRGLNDALTAAMRRAQRG